MSNEVNIIPMATVSATKDYVTVLSIEDDEPSSNSQTLFSDHSSSSNKAHMYHKYVPTYTSHLSDMRPTCSKELDENRSDEVVEVNGIRSLKKNGLHVHNASPKQSRRIEFDDSITRSRAKSYHEMRNGSLREKEQFKRIHKSGYFGGLPDSFVDDFDDLLPADLESENVRAQKIVLSQDTFGKATGISVTGVPDPKNPSRLSAVEIYRIEDGQRIAEDGQLQVGDCIIKINNRPIYQMSLTAARLYIDELKREEEPSIVFYRLSKVDQNKKDHNLHIKPLVAIVQQGNTAALHNLKDILITKSERGFGFGFASRRSEKGNIFMVTFVVSGGPSDELLFSGDRILKINDKDLSDLVQAEVTDLLKSCSVGQSLTFQISRTENAEESNEHSSTNLHSISDEINDLEDDDQILEFHIPVNEKAAAGLGLVLKGKSTSSLDSNRSAAVFIDRILRGSAAFKDGRLWEGDRILGIENLNLLQFKQNSEAAQAFNSYVSTLPSSCAYFRIFIARKSEIGNINSTNVMERKDFIAWMKDASNKPKNEDIERRESCEVKQTNGSQSSTANNSQDEASLRPQMNGHEFTDDRASIASIQQIDPFNRESATRKSFSEKGPFGAKNDPNRFDAFKQISHQRQISAQNSQNTKRRSMSEEPMKNENQLRTSNSNHEKLDASSPTATREALKKKRRSVGSSMFKFFQRTDSPPKVVQDEKTFINASRSKSMTKQNHSPQQLRPLSAFHHRRFNSAHDGLKRAAWSPPTNQSRVFDGESRQLGTNPSSVSPSKHSSTRRRTQASSHSFKQPNNRSEYQFAPAIQPPDYYNAFNQCFTAAQTFHPGNTSQMPFHAPASSTSPSEYRVANLPAYPSNEPYASASQAYFKQRYPAYHPPVEYYPAAPFYPIQYSPTAPIATGPSSSPNAIRQQYLYFGGVPASTSYSLDYAYNTNRRHSTRSTPRFSTAQPFDAVHVERL